MRSPQRGRPVLGKKFRLSRTIRRGETEWIRVGSAHGPARPSIPRPMSSETPPETPDLVVWDAFLRRIAPELGAGEDWREDVIQDTLLAAAARPPLDQRGARAWLRTVARNLTTARLRRASVRREVGLPDEGTLAATRDGPPPTEHALLQERIARQVQELPDPYRRVVLLRFYEGLDRRQIAERLGRPLNTVNSQLHRGLQRLREGLDEEHGGRRTAWLGALAAALGERPRPAAARAAAGAGGGGLGGLGIYALIALVTLGAVVGLIPLLWSGDATEELARRPVPGAEESAPAPSTTPPPAAAEGAGDTAAGRRPLAPGSEAATELEGGGGDAAAEEPAPGPTRVGWVDFTVVDESGAPLPGASIWVSPRAGGEDALAFWSFLAGWPEERVQADAAGRAPLELFDTDFAPMPEREESDLRARIQMRAPGRASSDWYLLQVGPGERLSIEAPMSHPATTYAGRVLDPDGRPLAGARVYSPSSQTGRHLGDRLFLRKRWVIAATDAEGRYELDGYLRGPGSVYAEAPGYVRQLQWRPAAEGERVELDFVLSRGGALEGRVLSPEGAPLAGVRVWVDLPDDLQHQRPVEARTGTDGRFRLAGIPPGERRVWAGPVPGTERTATAVLPFEEDGAIAWSPDLFTSAALRLRLLGEDGEPLAGWSLRAAAESEAESWSQEGATDGDGRVELGPCPRLSFRLEAFPSPDRLARGFPALVVDGVEPSADERELVVPDRARAVGSLRGTVVARAGAPPQYARIVALNPELGEPRPIDYRWRTGEFTAAELPAGSYTLVLETRTDSTAYGPFEVLPGEELVAGDLVLERTVEVAFDWAWPGDPASYRYEWIQGEERKRLAHVPLRRLAHGAAPPPRRSVLPGRYRLSVYRGDTALEHQWFTVEPDSPREVSTGPEPRASLVVWLEPHPVRPPAASPEVEVRRGGELVAERVMRTTAEGRYRAELSLPWGSYEVRVRAGQELLSSQAATLGDSRAWTVITVAPW